MESECLTCKKHYSQGGDCWEHKRNCLYYDKEPRGKMMRFWKYVASSEKSGRSAFGFEIDRNFYNRAKNEMLAVEDEVQMSIEDFIGGAEC